jgi:Leucine-rich repeat (LRR) protein
MLFLKLNDTAFLSLDVKKHNYNEIENLTLDGNKLESLPEKLLDMNLGMRFSAKHNQLTSISYDVSQRLIKTTDVLELSNNPWKCTCSSQINDLNLLAKVADRELMLCGPGSDIELENKRIVSLDPEILCPPSSNGESQELLLQLLCVLLAILIVLILSKLAYDFRVYRTRGQLPWLVLRMP